VSRLLDNAKKGDYGTGHGHKGVIWGSYIPILTTYGSNPHGSKIMARLTCGVIWEVVVISGLLVYNRIDTI